MYMYLNCYFKVHKIYFIRASLNKEFTPDKILTVIVQPCLYNPIAFRKAKIAYNFGLSECNRVNETTILGYETIKSTYLGVCCVLHAHV